MGFMGKLLGRRTRRGEGPDPRRGQDRTGGRRADEETGTWAVDVSVTPELKPIPQPSPMTCWAAAGTMLKSWQARRSLSIDEVLDGLGDRWRAKFDAGEVLSAVDLAAFARALGLVEQAPMEHSVMQLAEVLRDHGPVWVISDDGFEGNDTVHLRVVTAMKGDGTPEGTMVTWPTAPRAASWRSPSPSSPGICKRRIPCPSALASITSGVPEVPGLDHRRVEHCPEARGAGVAARERVGADALVRPEEGAVNPRPEAQGC